MAFFSGSDPSQPNHYKRRKSVSSTHWLHQKIIRIILTELHIFYHSPRVRDTIIIPRVMPEPCEAFEEYWGRSDSPSSRIVSDHG